ncbi:MAG TPA: hypothetical protein VGJ20_42440 [Xanthobacteraceae bacterium]|jgi:hypothetical protein
MGKWIKWIAAFLILIFVVAPVPIILTSSGQQFATRVGMQFFSWRFLPNGVAALGQKFFDDVRARDFMLGTPNWVPWGTLTPQLQAQLTKLADVFPNEKPLSVKLVGVNVVAGPTYQLTYEYEFSRRWILASIELRRSGDKLGIGRVNVQPLAEPLEQLNALTFVGKSQKYYLFAGAAMLLFVFSVVTVYACLFTPMARRKWLWVIFVMFGFMALNLNWTTGQFYFLPLTVIIPAARASSGFYSPWIVQIGLPLGAIVFWLRRRALTKVLAQRGDDERHLARADSQPLTLAERVQE